MKPFVLFLVPFCWLVALSPQATAEPVRTDNLTAELVSEWKGLVPGKTNTVAVRLKMDDHWHTYWANPGDSGLPTKIAWTLPEGITAGAIQWPAPQWIDFFDLVSYAYEGEVFLLVDLEVADSVQAGSSVKLDAKVDWLICKEACIPGGVDLSLTLPVVTTPEPSSWKSGIDATRLELPHQIPGWDLKVVDNGESFALTLVAPEAAGFAGREVTYFSLDGWVAPSEPRTSLAEGRILTLVMPKAEYEPDSEKDRFQGVLVSGIPWDNQDQLRALEVNLSFSDNATVAAWVAQLAETGALATGALQFSRSDSAPLSFGMALLFALVGGLLLNLMPCVFPVLSIKVLGFVQQAGEDASKVKFHGIVFTAGVVVSFWILAGLFLILRAAGQEIGWGFQLQTPGFVAVLASVLFLFGLNLSGVFEIGESLTGAGSKLQAKSGFTGSFFSGVLATIVATPCTAPFMGSALGVIVTLSAVESMLVFTALALGVASPYLILSFFPAFLKWLPRPGAWMETFKKALAFLLYATVVWLAWVFGNQVGVNGMAVLLLGLVIMGVAAWIWGNWGNYTKKKSVRRIAMLVALPVVLAGGWVQYQASRFEAPNYEARGSDSVGIAWETYSPETVSSMVAEGKTVYVDFTAKWCLTCQVNKKIAFGSEEVIQYFQDKSIVSLKGDWTRRDPVITRELQKFGRSGVPTNIIYRPDGSTKLLPEVLTPGIVLEALREQTQS
ncbi:MAG: protein-disulfide reductase DsbD family protein [Verrucomicrobia bacterium]|nr:protein-disulfide reductase DsbD family protein [Verrucomicrobiota bacterium]